MYQPIPFMFVDAREFDGNPYEVAEQAIAMVDGILQIAEKAVEVADLMARNAEMERNLVLKKPAAGDEWPNTPQGVLWAGQARDLTEIRRKMVALRAAAAYDPKHPPKLT